MSYQIVRRNILKLSQPRNWNGSIERVGKPGAMSIVVHISNLESQRMTLYFSGPLYFCGPLWWEGSDICIASLDDTIGLLETVPYNDKLRPDYVEANLRLYLVNTELPQAQQVVMLASSGVGVHTSTERKTIYFNLDPGGQDREILSLNQDT